MRQYIFYLLFFPLLLIAAIKVSAQSKTELSAAQIKLQLEKLDTLGSVLYVAAHPDDENTRLLAYLSNEKKYRTAYLSMTRGDGGQNLVGDEQGSELGLMRTQELLAARRIDGAEQFFTRANDFGFSKNPEETFRFWGEQRILADVVWRIRKFQPDVIICRFPPDSRAGHGHHQASAILAHEAFKAAADPKQFPEQLKYVKTWQAKRILWNTYNFGSHNTTSPDQFSMDVGVYNLLLGEGYGEMAAESRSMHKSQGFGVSKTRGESYEYFKTVYGSAPKNSLMDGVNTSWSRIEGGSSIGEMVATVNSEFNMDHPEKSIPLLLKIYQAVNQLPDGYWKEQKLPTIKQLLLACDGIWAAAYADDATVVPGGQLKLRAQVIQREGFPVSLESISYNGEEKQYHQSLNQEQLASNEATITINDSTKISQPYWLRESHPVGYYNVANQQLVGLPENPPQVIVDFNLQMGDQTITVTRPVVYKSVDPVKGEQENPLEITPPVVATTDHSVFIFSNQQPQKVQLTLKAMADHQSGQVHLQLPKGYSASPENADFNLSAKGDEQVAIFSIHPDNPINNSSLDTATVKLSIGGNTYDRNMVSIDYNYIPKITYFPKADISLVKLDIKTNTKRIGYIMGAGDKVPAVLLQLGYQVTFLNAEDLARQNLAVYDAIITGVRAYNTDDFLAYDTPKLLQYVKDGGILVDQYNKNFGLVTKDIGPYPFSVTGNRVTDEEAPVAFNLPDAAVLNTPNKITNKDFEGWIQERGIYFTGDQDAHYKKPLSMNDPREQPLDGSLIVTDYGKGKFVYSGLDFFRELPAGVPGAIRLFVNLISK